MSSVYISDMRFESCNVNVLIRNGVELMIIKLLLLKANMILKLLSQVIRENLSLN